MRTSRPGRPSPKGCRPFSLYWYLGAGVVGVAAGGAEGEVVAAPEVVAAEVEVEVAGRAGAWIRGSVRHLRALVSP